MPSPFPGMDPYLEEPGLWPDVHHRLISVAGDMLTEQLRPRYYARIEERVYVSDELDPARHVIAPDLRIVSGSGRRKGTGAITIGEAIDVAEPVEVTTLFEDEIHEPRIEVIDRLDRAVVAVIEILSPTNKVPGARGRLSYEQKRLEVMSSPSHFIEIDLLRAGEPFGPYKTLAPHDYRVHVSRVGRRPKGTLWPIRIEQRLPIIPIPLKEKDLDGSLDLQVVLETAYDRAAYDLEIDYRKDPIPPLDPPQAVWADRLLKEKGVR
jgi:hypothetical protein